LVLVGRLEAEIRLPVRGGLACHIPSCVAIRFQPLLFGHPRSVSTSW
jgi:hypothetical protein